MAAYRKQIVKGYRHPLWLTLFGGLVVLATLWMSVKTVLT